MVATYIVPWLYQNFLRQFGDGLLNVSPEEFEKAKHGIASHLLSGSETLGLEFSKSKYLRSANHIINFKHLVKWASYIYNGSYAFEQNFRITDALFNCSLQDLAQFYFHYIVNDAPERRKIVSGIVPEVHRIEDAEFEPDSSNGEIIHIQEVYSFKFQHDLISYV